MDSTGFDPFRYRLARDIRNRLSRAFLDALARRDTSLFRQCGEEFLRLDLEPGYENYVRKRLDKYEQAYRIIAAGDSHDAVRQASILWELQLYFEMHELLELEWRKAAGEERQALHGLVRAAGMKIHAENNNMKAAVTMAAKARDDLLQAGENLAGFDNRDSVLKEIEQTLAAALFVKRE